MDASLFKIDYSLGSIVSLIVNFALLVAAIFSLQRKFRQSVAVIALGCVLGLLATATSFLLYTVAGSAAQSAILITLGLQALSMLHNILWAGGVILLLMELKPSPAPSAP